MCVLVRDVNENDFYNIISNTYTARVTVPAVEDTDAAERGNNKTGLLLCVCGVIYTTHYYYYYYYNFYY